jgi:hypothetical protein
MKSEAGLRGLAEGLSGNPRLILLSSVPLVIDEYFGVGTLRCQELRRIGS